MKRFWSNLAVQLGKRAGAVSVVGLVLTLVLGLGITQLQFATGQVSYLNKDDQVAIEKPGVPRPLRWPDHDRPVHHGRGHQGRTAGLTEEP